MLPKKILSEKNIHFLFDVSLLIKAVLAFLEVVGGIIAYFITQDFLLDLIRFITQSELVEDPKDFLANTLLQSAQTLSINTQHFAAYYLLSHGVVKLWLIIGLLQKKLWYYPTALVIFGLFILYQLYRFSFSHSPWLLGITFLDIVVIVLTWHEYRYLRSHKNT